MKRVCTIRNWHYIQFEVRTFGNHSHRYNAQILTEFVSWINCLSHRLWYLSDDFFSGCLNTKWVERMETNRWNAKRKKNTHQWYCLIFCCIFALSRIFPLSSYLLFCHRYWCECRCSPIPSQRSHRNESRNNSIDKK